MSLINITNQPIEYVCKPVIRNILVNGGHFVDLE